MSPNITGSGKTQVVSTAKTDASSTASSKKEKPRDGPIEKLPVMASGTREAKVVIGDLASTGSTATGMPVSHSQPQLGMKKLDDALCKLEGMLEGLEGTSNTAIAQPVFAGPSSSRAST